MSPRPAVPSFRSLTQTTMKSPAGVMAILELPWFCVVVVLTWMSPPCATPAALNLRAKTSCPRVPLESKVVQVTAKLPAESLPTDGENWLPVVPALTSRGLVEPFRESAVPLRLYRLA